MGKWLQFGAAAATAATLGTGGVVITDRQIDPYLNKETHYELPIKSDFQQGERVEIAKDRAAMTLKGWNDEYAITITPQIPSQLAATDRPFTVKPDRPLLSKKMEYREGDVTAFIEPKSGTENEFDIDFTLHSRPDTNVFTYKIEGAEDFNFYYQPELTEEEIAEGAERPENVVGSYAVYHKTKANHRVSDTNYATGKVFHIYRPKAIDANGLTIWVELKYQNGLLSVIIPPIFLKNASYPVVVDPTFGYTSLAATGASLTGNTIRLSTTWTMPENGDVTQLTIQNANTAGVTLRPVIYNDSDDTLVTAGAQASFAATADTTCGNASNEQQNAPISATLSASTNYDFGPWHSSTIRFCYDTGTHELRGDAFTYHATNPPSNPFVEDSTLTSRNYAIYATYTASGGGSTTTTDPGIIWFDE